MKGNLKNVYYINYCRYYFNMRNKNNKLWNMVCKKQEYCRRNIGIFSCLVQCIVLFYIKIVKKITARKIISAVIYYLFKSIGMLTLPSPAVLTHFVYASFGYPIKLLFSLCRICIALSYISRTSWVNLIRKLLFASSFKGM